MDREKLLEKLKKIRALAEDGKTDGEQRAALLAFQRLLDKYGLKASEVYEAGEADPDTVKYEYIHTAYKLETWVRLLHSVIAKHFRCLSLIENRPYQQFKALQLCGLERDVLIASETFYTAKEVAESAYSAYRVKTSSTDDNKAIKIERANFLENFVEGLNHAYDLQEQASSELALIVVMPPTVEKEAEKYHKARIANKAKDDDYIAAYNGFIAGENYGAGNRIHAEAQNG